MQRKVKIVCCVIGFLALLCAATGFAAEGTRTKSVQPSGSTCSYPGSPAYGLGTTAVVCLELAQSILLFVLSGYSTCCRSEGTDTSSSPRWNYLWKIFRLLYVVLLLLAVGLAVTLLLAGTDLNRRFVRTLGSADLNQCPVAGRFFFAGATALGLLSIGMQLKYYIDESTESELLPT